jgi:hypothetical protein
MATAHKHSKKAKREDESRKAAETSKTENQKWDDVAEASWESFPASDPPSFTMRQPAEPPKKPREN